ncbi:uncharacterized protein N7518_000059 [Penicillium psychrosexuale]|uniref:uncharacterized protein n=1 Tax=Penicillium psychrosexuale TaxID=1002107 RepID=UPI0025457B62|nr:uncharacterized protein N7518_000059 [Penicillium psychrosexuale]KAJ5803756.1 hypothetical protein N7518_000059 [Penicillium psychrosexuale]
MTIGPCIWELSGSPKLLYTNVIFQDSDKYFSAQLPERFACPDDIPPKAKSCLKEIPAEHIWPPLEDGLSICHDAKKPGLLSVLLLQEARIYQILMQNEYQNIARYLRCIRYMETLADRLKAGRSVDNESYLQQIKAGIDHLHALNLIHNDIYIRNIMIVNQEADAFMIIDFDSCTIKGHRLPAKHTRVRIPEDIWTAETENDDLGFKLLQEKLLSGDI